LFSSGSDSSIVILDLETKTVLKRIKSDWGVIHFAWFSADEKYLLWGDSYGYLYKTDLVSWVSSKVRLDETAINCLVANEKMDEIIAVSDLGMLYILDFEKLSVSQRLIVSNSRAFVVEYLDIDENIIITSDENGEFKLYERNEDLFYLTSTISAHEGICCTIIYNDDKTKLLSGGQDGWIKEWSINDFRLINKIDTKGFE
jgi:WD40 repeat protein